MKPIKANRFCGFFSAIKKQYLIEYIHSSENQIITIRCYNHNIRWRSEYYEKIK